MNRAGKNFWWKTPTDQSADDTKAEAIRRAISATSKWRNYLAQERYQLEWAYDRDRLFNRYGAGATSLAQSPGGGGAGAGGGHLEGSKSTPSPNIVREATDTIVAWTIAEQPPVTVSSDGATFADQYAIEEFEVALDSVFNTPATEETLRLAGRDGVLGGIGYAMPTIEAGELAIKRLMPWQVHIDPIDGRDRKPLSCIVVEYLDRGDILHILDNWDGIESVKSKRSRIERMESTQRRSGGNDEITLYDLELSNADTAAMSDQLKVVHAWRRATAPGRDDGRYIMMVHGKNADGAVIMIDMVYSNNTLPVCWFNPLPAIEGINGSSMGALLLPWQEALDRSMFKMQRALDKYGHIRVLVGAGEYSAQQRAAMATWGVAIIEVEGTREPKIFDPQVVRREDVENVARIRNLSMSTYGINAMMSRGASQLGAGASGQALQEEHYRSLDRFSDLVKNWQSFRLALASEMLNVTESLLENLEDFRVEYTYMGRRRVQTWAGMISLKDRCRIALELRGEAAVRRGGRTQRLQEWASQGLITPETAKQYLLGTPDTRAAARVSLAPIHLVEWQLRRVIESEDWYDAQPDADTPLDIAVARSTAMIQRAHVEGAEAKVIERLREYKAQAEAILRGMQAQAQAAQQILPEIPTGQPV